VLARLGTLDLRYTEVTDAGCATLTAALDSGALPALRTVKLTDTGPASDGGRAAVQAARRLASGRFCIPRLRLGARVKR
jgi:hypothetical protein